MTTQGKRGSIFTGRVDLWIIGIYVVLVALGWLNLYAAVYDDTQASAFNFAQEYGKQIVWIGLSVAMALVIMLIDDKYYHMLAYPIYGVALVLMLSTLLFGKEINGAKAWLVFGPVAIQPTEFMKFATSLALARFMSHFSFSLSKFNDLASVALIIAVPVGVMFLQHDVGSAVVYASFLFMLYREGLNRWVYIVGGMIVALFMGSFWITDVGMLLLLLVGCTLGFAVQYRAWKGSVIYLAAVVLTSILAYLAARFLFSVDVSYYWVLLGVSLLSLPVVGLLAYGKRLGGIVVYIALFVASVAFVSTTDVVFDHLDLHQQKRILDLLGIESDLRNWGYNVNQSKIAIGSGGFLGKGFLEGTQTKFNFVPEQSTDFIFCTVGEEWGFVGSVVVLALFCVLILRLVRMGERQGEPFSRIYCYCVAGIFFVHVFINIGMTIGLMPVIGIPLPFFSYGGSSFLAFTILLFVALRLDVGSSVEQDR
ncbi:MAG: rod shape-determining protein RodA [Rikenellaceae bacterium]|jgi:rod shape determining protein RodA|nr:rod shape-determining protein RodA [Rikenellaceae bacterium]